MHGHDCLRFCRCFQVEVISDPPNSKHLIGGGGVGDKSGALRQDPSLLRRWFRNMERSAALGAVYGGLVLGLVGEVV